MKSNHKFRTTIYLGKENYKFLEEFTKTLNCSMASLAKLSFDYGIEKLRKEVKDDEERNKQK